MRYIELRENREHGTSDFPYAYYLVSEEHPRYNMIYHWHAESELLLIRSGTLFLSVDGRNFLLSAGDCIFLAGGQLHGGVPENCTYECLVFNADSLLHGVEACVRDFGMIAEIYHPSGLIFTSSSPIAGIAEKIFTFMKEKPRGYHFFVRGELLNLLGEILGLISEENIESFTPTYLKKLRRLKHVIRYISDHYRDPITLDELARQCGMNSNYFCRAFKGFTGMTPVEYLNFYRVESACERILRSEESLTEIAFQSGFNDFSYFIKVFKKYKGITPSQYSKNIDNSIINIDKQPPG